MLEAPKTFAVHLLLVEGGKRVARYDQFKTESLRRTTEYTNIFAL